eukprot:CAMPEP_0172190166 /NCGR_PEP_ID=MMETSP1050-20130122/22956_1 /TAXON_ID=233186 /ORGANISM="Cryptomonas curvata, Strain CCAP979/52" /LENGTH=373 /DNA_ID=CAMNT_0012864997 /DNA_START=60 /DNA_END=1178 /DNA_ORIENTATION=+
MENDPNQPAETDPTHHMSREHAAAFKRVLEKRRVVWCDYAAAFQAALDCVNTKQSQEFASKYVLKGVTQFCGEGDPPVSYGQGSNIAGSAWDDWCGKGRRKLNERAEDQTVYFQQALRCAVRLVLAALDRGAADMIDAADPILDKNSPIFNVCREVNRAAYEEALELHRECVEIWREGGGPAKRMALLEKAPWKCLVNIVRGSFAERRTSGADATDLLNRVANRLENAPPKELSEAGNCCFDLIQLVRTENRLAKRSHSSNSPAASALHSERKAFKQRLMSVLRQLALKCTKSGVWLQRRDALRFLEAVVRAGPEYKALHGVGAPAGGGKCACAWLDEAGVLEGRAAHATIVSETAALLALIELNEARLSVIL